MSQSFHFIAIGGAVMHQLAIYLHQQGDTITGSDDVIFDPAQSNLKQNGLLPAQMGWLEANIHPGLDGVILGMHAKADNPELIKAQQLGLKIYSFPEFIYERSKNKKRLVVAGSHGKTTITSMIMHILRSCDIQFDYLVGSQIKGFDTMVKISDAPIIVLEGDEYLSSPIDSSSKFLHYHPHIAIISGIAWDHINVFPSFEQYLQTFELFIQSIDKEGTLIYYKNDIEIPSLIKDVECKLIPYEAIHATYSDAFTKVKLAGETYNIQLFGDHNMENLNAALLACKQLGVSFATSLKMLESFEGSAKRLEVVYQDFHQNVFIYRDFAHAPSKLTASLKALRSKYPDYKIVAVFELHTYSSLQEDFLPFYADSLAPADVKAVFLDEHALKIKGKSDIKNELIQSAFNDITLPVIRTKTDLERLVEQQPNENIVFAFMSSGNFAGFDINSWSNKFIKK
ncbi:MAG: peptidoglycan synthetase [Bacteroidetes bacterium]|nr:peptidoglycan synthetase [Bacteroidota bacterium]